MTECLHLSILCSASVEAGDSLHHCFLDEGHPGGTHVCICWWVRATDELSRSVVPTPDEKIAAA